MTALEICNMALDYLKVPSIDSLTAESTKEEEICTRHFAPARQEILRKHPWNFAKTRTTLYAVTTTPPFEFDYKFLLPSDFARLCFIGSENEGLVGKEYAIETDNYILSSDNYSSAEEKTITGITQADPGVVTCEDHGFEDGQVVLIEDVAGMTSVNDTHFTVANATTDTFSLQTQAATPADVDTSGYAAYTSGGVASLAPSLPIGYIFDEDDTTKFDALFIKAFALQLAVNMSYAFAGKTTLRTDCRNLLAEALQEARAVNGQDKPPIRITRSRVIGARRRYSSGLGYEGNPSRIPD